MADHPVETAWVWRFGTAPFKATYGRLPGTGSTTYTKDFLQASGQCAAAFDEVFPRVPGQPYDVTLAWPGGSREGKVLEAADYAANGRINLRWETDNPPDPWRLSPNPAHDAVATFPGDPSQTTEHGADQELEALKALDVDPWLVVVKLQDQPDVLHLRAYLGNPPTGLEHTSAQQLPDQVRSAMASVPANGGCAVARFAGGAGVRAPRIVNQVLQALRRGPNVLLVGPPGTGKTVALEDLRHLYEHGSPEVTFDPSKMHDAWSESSPVPTGKVRTIVFHPSYSYEEFVLGLYPVPAAGSGVALFPRPGPLVSLAHWASHDDNAALLIVDEFNRGNAAAIFGDMLALLDKDKRSDLAVGSPGASVDRAYPELGVDVPAEMATSAGTSVGNSIRLPMSLSIVAAMNSSDRSVAPLDAALRRRFSIVRVDPDYDVLSSRLGITTPIDFDSGTDPVSWSAADVSTLAVVLLRSLNERIELVLGPDFQLGHSVFWDVRGADAEEATGALSAAFDERVVSTMRMTFADQDESLAAILNGPPPPTGSATTAGSPPMGLCYWVIPGGGLEAVAPARLRIRLAQSLAWTEAATALVALL
ncbi:McrB family protein [Actinomarinicola tropica]|uniref:AAA domain-containing protein n=1 Tax=Actinomarinicola tropica TaxID=2789776 RepID=A0A5Q2RMI7_9ACTN|nr:AAA family ATPase [Actinomarinicola tropica]QGG96684.1 AAA domain-containing protein [Actinomarinicola tropica]